MNNWNSTFKRKFTKPMKRSRLKIAGVSTTAQLKKEIQGLVRDIVILRDDGCIFKKEKGHICSGYAPKAGHLILQADHLLSRSNSATFADTRLIVCVCKGIHGWKSTNTELRKKEYDQRVKKLISKERVKLWEKAEEYTHAHKTYKPDWRLEIINLKQELDKYSKL